MDRTRTIGLFSVGAPDVTQGGGGIFNELVCRYLLAQGFRVRGYFRYPEWFREHLDPSRQSELEALGLEAVHVPEETQARRFAFGMQIVDFNHQMGACRRAVERDWREIERFDGVISLDLGWAIALAGLDVPTVALLGDRKEQHLRDDFSFSLTRRSSWREWAQIQSLRGIDRSLRRLLRPYAGEHRILGSFAPQHARELTANGIPCRHFQWFTPTPERVERRPRREGPLRILHVGSLASTASRRMLAYWNDELLPALATLPFELELRLVGRLGSTAPDAGRAPNVRVVLTDHLEGLEDEFAEAAAFFSPMRHRVGIRTRLVSALSYGLPVLADSSAADGLPELTDGLDVLYASDAAAATAALRRIHDEPDWAEQIGARGRETWLRHFDPERNVPALVAALGL